jgi:hypothetical protein
LVVFDWIKEMQAILIEPGRRKFLYSLDQNRNVQEIKYFPGEGITIESDKRAPYVTERKYFEMNVKCVDKNKVPVVFSKDWKYIKDDEKYYVMEDLKEIGIPGNNIKDEEDLTVEEMLLV